MCSHLARCDRCTYIGCAFEPVRPVAHQLVEQAVRGSYRSQPHVGWADRACMEWQHGAIMSRLMVLSSHVRRVLVVVLRGRLAVVPVFLLPRHVTLVRWLVAIVRTRTISGARRRFRERFGCVAGVRGVAGRSSELSEISSTKLRTGVSWPRGPVS